MATSTLSASWAPTARRLADDGVKALVVIGTSASDPYLAPFVGPVHLASSLVVLPASGAPRLGYLTPMERDGAAATGLELITPEQLDMLRWTRDGALPDEMWANVVSRALHLCELAPGELALAGSLSAGWLSSCCRRLAEEGWTFRPGEPYLDLLRKTKTSRDIRELEAVCAGIGEAYGEIISLLRRADSSGELLRIDGEPLTVGHLRQRVAAVFSAHGLAQPHGNIVAPGEQGAVPHNVGDNGRALRPGESLVVDLFPKGTLYGDCTRTFCVGTPTDAFRDAFGHVQQALRAAEEATESGVVGWDLQELVCERFDAAGYATPITEPGTEVGYVHGLGHGVGFELHELPTFRPNLPAKQGTLSIGDVLTLEPGLYEPAAGWAVRIENLYVLQEDGLRNLTPFPETWDPERWVSKQ